MNKKSRAVINEVVDDMRSAYDHCGSPIIPVKFLRRIKVNASFNMCILFDLLCPPGYRVTRRTVFSHFRTASQDYRSG